MILNVCDNSQEKFPVFKRYKVAEVSDLKQGYHFVKLQVDTAFGDLRADLAGVAYLRVGIATPQEWSQQESSLKWNMEPR